MLAIHNLSKTYADGTVALRQLNLNASQGMFGLLGPNGAGKSSLLRTIASLQPADQGEIRFRDIDVLDDPVRLRRQLGYLPQSFGVYPHMSCYALLEHIAVLKGVLHTAQRRAQIASLLALTNLTEVAHKTVAHFSGGMRQRFGIAQALLGEPSLIILDEPTAGLDPEERQRLHRLLVEISLTRLVVFSTHIVEDIEQLCQQVAILLSGRIALQGDTESLIQPLHGKIWQECWQERWQEHLQEHRQERGGNRGVSTALPDHCVLLNSVYMRGQPVRRIYVGDAGAAPVAGFQAVAASLQDRYFLALAQERV